MNPLGRHARRIESEYLERLNKVRYGLDGGWQPPGLMLKGGTDLERSAAIQRLRVLAGDDGFACSYIYLGADLPLRDTRRICRAAIDAITWPEPIGQDTDPQEELRRLAASSRKFGRDGWVLLIDNVDTFPGSPKERAESYRELTRWMGALPGNPYLGLFCLLAVTPAFEQAVADPDREFARVSADSGPDDSELLAAASSAIGTLRHEATAQELLVLEF